jgi:hypothetical protein
MLKSINDQNFFRLLIVVGFSFSAYSIVEIGKHVSDGILLIALLIISPYWWLYDISKKTKYDFIDLIFILFVLPSGMIPLGIAAHHFHHAIMGLIGLGLILQYLLIFLFFLARKLTQKI